MVGMSMQKRGSAFAQTRTVILILPMSLDRQRSIFSSFSCRTIGGAGADVTATSKS